MGCGINHYFWCRRRSKGLLLEEKFQDRRHTVAKERSSRGNRWALGTWAGAQRGGKRACIWWADKGKAGKRTHSLLRCRFLILGWGELRRAENGSCSLGPFGPWRVWVWVGPCEQEKAPGKWLPPSLESAFWLFCALTLTVRDEAGLAVQLPSEPRGGSPRSDRNRDRTEGKKGKARQRL